MKEDEVRKVIDILLECDGGCEYCVANLIKLFSEKFPEYKEIAYRAFRDNFNEELEDFLNQAYDDPTSNNE